MLDIRQLAYEATSQPIYPDSRFPPSLYYRFLKLLAQELKPNLSVELGVCGGGGSLHLSLGYPEGQVIGIDIAWDHEENIQHIIEKCANFHFVQGDSISLARDIHSLYGKVDILFIDTVHTYDQTLREFHAWYPYLSDKAVICLDDLFRPGMNQAWNDLPGNKLRLDFLHTGAANGGGFGVIWM